MLPDERTTHNDAVTLPAHVEALVVAPDRNISRPLISFLRQEGIAIRVSDDLDAAFEEALMHPPDVVLIDDAATGKRGVELCERLKGSVRTHFVPTIVIMPDGDHDLRIRAVAAGVDAIFSPSVEAGERRSRLWALLRTRALFRRLDRKQRHQGTEIVERRRWFAYLLHDLQGSIGAMTANIEFLAQFAPPVGDRRRRDFDESVQDAGIVLDQLVHNVRTVLDFDGFEAGTLAPVVTPLRIGDLLRDVVDTLTKNPLMLGEIELLPGAEEPVLRLDAQLMRSALTNLLMHCLKHGSGRTTVGVTSRRRAAVIVEICCAELTFAEADKLRIFEPYNQLDDRPVAYGVGLALARAVVEAHGGEIWVESSSVDEGAGSFVFSLPVTAEPRRGRRLA
jgi:signal transduction histidine kinase